ncbi:MAG: hypothetical protein HY701_06485, partial [Gemmatimonadetes bacterium]|nr:hypothetical protein [Gemmatimonadota bacterium]
MKRACVAPWLYRGGAWPGSDKRRRPGAGTAAGVLLLALLGASCDLPFDVPKWPTQWVLTIVADTLGTERFLPDGVKVGGSAFVLDPRRLENHIRIGEVCELCTCFAGAVPALNLDPFDWPVPLPPGVVSASLTGGSAHVTVRNEMAFDLLNNGQGETGWLGVQLVDPIAGQVVRSLTYDGPFPPGDSVMLDFDLRGIELHRSMAARILGFTPGTVCDVRLDPESGIRANVELQDVRASAIHVVVADAAFALRPRSVELPQALSQRLRAEEGRAVLEVEIENTVAVALDLTLSAAARSDSLFTHGAALFTPVLVPAGSPAVPGRVHKIYVLDLGALHRAERIYVSALSRVVGDRRVRIGGGERVLYRATLDAE